MDIAVIGTGFIGTILGRSLAESGHHVVFGSRHPEQHETAAGSTASVASIADALASAEVVILAVPSTAVAELAANFRDELDGKLVIDATNKMGEPVSNSRAALPAGVRYAGPPIPSAARTWRTRCSGTGVRTCSSLPRGRPGHRRSRHRRGRTATGVRGR